MPRPPRDRCVAGSPLRPVLSLLPLLLRLLLLSPAPRALAQERVELTVFASDHYYIHTNLTQAETVPLGRHVDAVYERFTQRFAGYRSATAPTLRMPLYLFRTQEQYLGFLRSYGIAAEGSGGMFFVTHRLRGLATWADDRPRSQTLRTLQHEGFHQFAWHHLGRNLPTWLNEGLAQYFEDAVILESGMKLGLANPQRLALVRDALAFNYALPLPELCQLDHHEWSHTLSTNASRSELLYGQAWSLVFYLIHGDDGRYLPAFERYLRMLGTGKPPDDAFQIAFGYGAEEAMETRWRRATLDQRLDAVTVAAERLRFLAAALNYKHQRREPMPRRLAQLRDDLQTRGFTLTRSTHGLQEQYDARQDELFTYTRPDGRARDFLMLEPAGHGLPPRLLAPGLDPEPSLEWSRSRDQTLTWQIQYR